MGTEKRKRIKSRPWFLSRQPTPVSSHPVNLSQFSETSRQFQQSLLDYTQREISTNNDDNQATVDEFIKQDLDCLNQLFGPHFHHLTRHRNAQLLLAQKKRMQESLDKGTKNLSSVLAMSSKIYDFNRPDRQESENSSNSNNSALLAPSSLNNSQAASSSRQSISDDLSVLLRGFEREEEPDDNEQAMISGDNKFDQLKIHLELIRSHLEMPFVEMLMDKNYVGVTRAKRVVHEGIPPSLSEQKMVEGEEINHNDDNCNNVVDENEIIIDISVYDTVRPLAKAQEFQVLSSSVLSDFRDCLYCPVDEYSTETRNRKDSGYFFINSTFYNDTRFLSSIDYSKPVIEWSRLISDHVYLESAEMQYTRWKDVSDLRINYPYVYIHQGDCAHVIMISSICKYSPCFHPSSKLKYPYPTFQKIPKRLMCRFCKEFPCTKVTLYDSLADSHPALFCTQCFDELHSGSDMSMMKVYDMPSDIPRIE